jgi:hypothetical protein
MPKRSSLRSILIRSLIFAAILYVLLVTIGGSPAAAAGLLVVIFFLISIPLGLFVDRMRYRSQMRKIERRKTGSAATGR